MTTATDSTNDILKQIHAALNSSNGLDKLAPAFVAAWGEMPNAVKNSTNPHLGNDYVDLAGVMEVIKPVFSKHGLALWQCPGKLNATRDTVTVHCILLHTSGQRLVVDSDMPCGGPPKKGTTEPTPATAQTVGSATTYCKRYQGMSIGGMAPVDDDGNAASAANPRIAATREAEEAATAAAAASWLTRLKAVAPQSMTVEEFEAAFRKELEDLNDESLVKPYLAKRKEMKGAKGAKKKVAE